MRSLLLLSLLSTFCYAHSHVSEAQTPPLGYWVSYHHGEANSVIEIKKSPAGTFYGVVVAGLFHGDSHPEEYCTECSDKTWTGEYGIRKGEKVLGKSVLWDFHPDGDSWGNGKILRLKSGSVYDASFRLDDDNKALNLTVNAGFFKKTVTWTAVSADDLKKYCTRQEAYHENGKTLAIECVPELAATKNQPEHSSTTDSDDHSAEDSSHETSTASGASDSTANQSTNSAALSSSNAEAESHPAASVDNVSDEANSASSVDSSSTADASEGEPATTEQTAQSPSN